DGASAPQGGANTTLPQAVLPRLEAPVAPRKGGPEAAPVEVALVQAPPVVGSEKAPPRQARGMPDHSVVPVVLLELITALMQSSAWPAAISTTCLPHNSTPSASGSECRRG